MFKYSIIMPVYNAESKLKISVESIIHQTYENWELIVVDDGSTDNSYDVLKNYSKKEKRIKVLHQENSGPGPARNLGIEYATGDYICFIDSDDYFDSNYLKKIESVLSNEIYDLIYISIIQEDTNGKTKNIINVKKYNKKNKEDLIPLQLIGIIPWGAFSKIVRRNLIGKSLFQKLDVGEELIYSCDLIQKANKIVFLGEPIYHYVYNEKGQHKKGGLDPWKPVVDSLKTYLIEKNIYKKYQKSINTLAVRALTIATYRCCTNYKYSEAKKALKQIIKTYQNEYNLSLYENDNIDKKSKVIMFCIKNKLYLSIYLMSRIRAKNK